MRRRTYNAMENNYGESGFKFGTKQPLIGSGV